LFRPRKAAPTPNVVSLTTEQGRLAQPTFSPDGNQVAYMWDGEKHDNFDIYVKLIGSPTALRLTTDPAPDAYPVWSPDGRQVAFLRGQQIYAISPLGGPERKLAEVPGMQCRFSWSSDSKWIAVAQVLAPHETNGIFLISTDGLQRRRLTARDGLSFDSEAAFSPDGHRLAYATCSPADLCVLSWMELSADLSPRGPPRRLNAGTLTRPALTWSSDGQSVIYDRRLPHWAISNDRLWRIGIQAGSEPQRLDYTEQGARFPAVSRVGNRLAYDQTTLDFDIWKWKEGKAEKLIASNMVDESPQYSPGGGKIAFETARSGSYEIWVANADGSSPAQLTFSSIASGSPTWSPDGHWIAYDGLDAAGQYNIFAIDALGGPPRQVTRDFTSYRPSFSRDGKWIYFMSNNKSYRIAFAGGTPVQVTDNGGLPCESWDGKSLYYVKTGSDRGALFVRALDGGPEKHVLDFVGFPSGFNGQYAIAREGIYYIGGPNPDGTFTLNFLDPATSRSRLLAKLPRIGLGLSVSPDGAIAYTVASTARSGDLRLVEHFH
jgi:eukaryotic-like serine/threonine-protein kinase